MVKPGEMSLNFACMAIMTKYVSLVKDKGLGIDDQLTVEQSTAILAEAMTTFAEGLDKKLRIDRKRD
ncbi:MAG: hypothetical protein IKY80_05325 [Alistipes sp.]|nr:hypothetical protein [Alistipes sp.]